MPRRHGCMLSLACIAAQLILNFPPTIHPNSSRRLLLSELLSCHCAAIMAEPATKRKREDDESMSGNASPSAAVAATVVTATTNSPLTTNPPPTANPPPTTNTSLTANSPPMTNPSLTANTTPTTNPSLTANPPPTTNGVSSTRCLLPCL